MITVVIIITFVYILSFFIYASFNVRSEVFLKTFSKLPAKEKIIALTFDDGPHPEITPLILDLLKKYNIQATFFCVGENIEKNQSLVKRIIRDGHLLGNHTNSHSRAFPFFSSSRMKKEIDVCWNRMVFSGLKDTIRLFRPPFGVTNPCLRKALKNSGFTVIGWSIRSFDTIIKNPVTVFRRVTKRIQPGSILLFHDTQHNTPEIIERVIIFALKKGYTFVRVDEFVSHKEQ